MDTITHTLVGVLQGRVQTKRLGGRGVWMLALAANAPDIDVLSGLRGQLESLAFRHGWTHSLVLSPLIAVLPLALWPWIRKKAEPGSLWRAFMACYIAVCGHLFLDWIGSYGTRYLLPWSETWFALDWVNIIDFWVWAILIGSVFAGILSRLVGGEIGGPKKPGAGTAWFGLILLFLYIGFHGYLHQEALQVLQPRLYHRETPKRVVALPTPAVPWRWTGVVETDSSWLITEVTLGSEFDPEAARVLRKPDAGPWLEAVRRTRTGEVWFAWSQLPYIVVTPVSEPDGGKQVVLHDLRFGPPEENRFIATFLLDSQNKVVEQSFQFGFGRVAAP